jgi:hypothetical protein
MLEDGPQEAGRPPPWRSVAELAVDFVVQNSRFLEHAETPAIYAESVLFDPHARETIR